MAIPAVPAPAALGALHVTRLIAVIRADSAELARRAAHAVLDGGIPLVEITFTVPDAVRVMKELTHRADGVVGAGTVLTAEQCRAALDAGMQFIVAPNFSPEVARAALAAGALYVPGAYTPSEIVAARAGGGHVIKVHPVGIAGGPAFIRVVRDPLPDVPLLAAGGTSLDTIVPFLEAGCVGVGLGPAIADPALARAGDFSEITRRAAACVERVQMFTRAGAAPTPR